MKRSLVRNPYSAECSGPDRVLWRLFVRYVALVVAPMTGLVLILAPCNVTSQPVPVDKLRLCISSSGEVRVARILPELPNLPASCPQGWKTIVVPTKGPRGEQGEQGPPGRPGTPGGRDCWDLNENGIKDPEEDVNGDGRVDVLDCKGPKGDKGDPGPLAQVRCETVQRTYDTDIDLSCPSGYTALFAICEGASMGTLIFADQSSGLVSYLIPPGAAATGVHCAAVGFTASTARLRCCKTVSP